MPRKVPFSSGQEDTSLGNGAEQRGQLGRRTGVMPRSQDFFSPYDRSSKRASFFAGLTSKVNL